MWFTETAWPPIVVCLAAAALLFAAWFRTQRGGYLLGAAGMVLACVALFAIETMIVTPAEEVESSVTALAEAVSVDDVPKTLDFFSSQATAEKALVEGALGRFRVQQSVHIKDLRVRTQAEDSMAISHFRANGTGMQRNGGASQHVATRWELRWRREGGQWKITEITRLDPISGREITLLHHSVN